MLEHRFGGDWTQEKLVRLSKYLPAYTKIFHRNPYARRNYKTVYVDAFAGTGYRSTGRDYRTDKLNPALLEVAVPETEDFLKGSASIALEVEPSFDRYLFIEKKPQYAQELEKLKVHYPNKADKMAIIEGDANQSLEYFCESTDWSQWRAVVFLDPKGMQVQWSTIERIANTKAIDLWLLFPLAQAVNRLLTKQPPPEKWAQALTRTLGTPEAEWRQEFYAPQSVGGLFDDQEIEGVEVKNTDFDRIGKFFVKRLRTKFPEVADNPLCLYNSQNIPLFLLCFASHNQAGLNIAKHILGR